MIGHERNGPLPAPAANRLDQHPAASRAGHRRLLLIAILITGAVLGVEAVGGVLANSLALLSDAGHVLTDLLALILGYTAFLIAGRPANARKSFGYYRVEILAALLNGALLLVIAGAILRESFLRLGVVERIDSVPMILAAALGLGGNLASMTVLSSARSNLNLRGAFLHLLSDALSSVAVLVAGVGVMVTGWTSVDAATGGVIGVVIILGALRLVEEYVAILLEAC